MSTPAFMDEAKTLLNLYQITWKEGIHLSSIKYLNHWRTSRIYKGKQFTKTNGRQFGRFE